jgi:hypothetical protein
MMLRVSFRSLAFALAFLLLFGCAASPPSEGAASGTSSAGLSAAGNASAAASPAVQKVEIIHFHGTHQCYSCITVGDYAEETVNRYFAQELATGRVTFAHVNAELPENRELAEKYGVTGASLWIGVYDDAGFHKEQNTNVWYKISDKDEYMSYLKGIIEKRLAGDLS